MISVLLNGDRTDKIFKEDILLVLNNIKANDMLSKEDNCSVFFNDFLDVDKAILLGYRIAFFEDNKPPFKEGGRYIALIEFSSEKPNINKSVCEWKEKNDIPYEIWIPQIEGLKKVSLKCSNEEIAKQTERMFRHTNSFKYKNKFDFYRIPKDINNVEYDNGFFDELNENEFKKTFIDTFNFLFKNKRIANNTNDIQKVVQQLTNCYKTDINDFYFDRFNILNEYVPERDGYHIEKFTFPKEDNTSLWEATKERAKELGSVQIAWSGGVDSTFILAAYKSVGIIPKVIVYKETFRCYNKELIDYINKEFNPKYLLNDEVCSIVYTGGCCDLLFASGAMPKGSIKKKILNEKSTMAEYFYQTVPEKTLKEWAPNLEDYLKMEAHANMFKQPKNNLQLVQWAVFCFAYYPIMYKINFFDLAENRNQLGFFDTQKFTDIAYTQYWYNNGPNPRDKSYQKSCIKEVFGNDFGVCRND